MIHCVKHVSYLTLSHILQYVGVSVCVCHLFSRYREWREKKGGVLFLLKEWNNRVRVPLRVGLCCDVMQLPWLRYGIAESPRVNTVYFSVCCCHTRHTHTHGNNFVWCQMCHAASAGRKAPLLVTSRTINVYLQVGTSVYLECEWLCVDRQLHDKYSY